MTNRRINEDVLELTDRTLGVLASNVAPLEYLPESGRKYPTAAIDIGLRRLAGEVAFSTPPSHYAMVRRDDDSSALYEALGRRARAWIECARQRGEELWKLDEEIAAANEACAYANRDVEAAERRLALLRTSAQVRAMELARLREARADRTDGICAELPVHPAPTPLVEVATYPHVVVERAAAIGLWPDSVDDLS